MGESVLVTSRQVTVESLISHAVQYEGCVLCKTGGLVARTGERTGRSLGDRYIVSDEKTKDRVSWGKFNQPVTRSVMDSVWAKAKDHMASTDQLFEDHYQIGANEDYALSIQAQTEYAWHQLFIKHLFINQVPADRPNLLGDSRQWQLFSLPGLELDKEAFKLNSASALFIDFSEKRVLLCGLKYAGEMKKAFFSVLNYLLPSLDVLPMHCAANQGKSGDVSLFFGLSGTGKTSLSSDVNRQLIGDDEHGWSKDKVFNFEGGCYAKCINLEEDKEPLIWHASQTPGAVLENVVLDKDKKPDFTDCSLTKNTRVAYSRQVLGTCVPENQAGIPNRVIFLTCDLYGVLPPVACLTIEQARFWFLNGYTAMIGNTLYNQDQDQSGFKSIQPTFSACFGQEFFPLSPMMYADLLEKRLSESGAEVYLVNTGWHSGSHQRGGTRFDIALTRQIIDHIHAGSVTSAKKTFVNGFDLTIPEVLEGVPHHLLNPQKAWTDQASYQAALVHLKMLCEANYSQYAFTKLSVEAGLDSVAETTE